MKPYRVGIVTASDRGASGERRTDNSGDRLALLVVEANYRVVERHLLPDDQWSLSALLAHLADSGEVDLLLTTGGTGLGPRDVTPEATRAVIEREVQGIPEAMRAATLARTPMAMLSRGVAGIRGRTLIINLPGSPDAVDECWEAIAVALWHGMAVLTGGGHEDHAEAR